MDGGHITYLESTITNNSVAKPHVYTFENNETAEELARAIREVHQITQRSAPSPIRKLGNPVPMGLGSFAFCLFIVSMANVHARGVTSPNMVVGAALLYGGVTQLLAGMWAMALEDTFTSTVFASYGAFWASYATLLIPGFGIAKAYKPEEFGTAVSFYIFGWVIFTTMMLILVLKSTVGFFVLFLVLDLVFILLAVGNYTSSVAVLKAAGWSGLTLVFIAFFLMYTGITDPENSYWVPKNYMMPKRKTTDRI